jgi:hypothetical protein
VFDPDVIMKWPVYTVTASGPDIVPEGWTPDRWSFRVSFGVPLEGARPEFEQLLAGLAEAACAYLETADYGPVGVPPADSVTLEVATQSAEIVLDHHPGASTGRRRRG